VEDTELRDHLKTTLPEYMIPPFLVQLKQLPLTPNGKVDKRALPEVGRIDGPSPAPHEREGTETEKRLLEIWAEILDREDIGIDDVFFDLGGHSMKAMKLMSLINKRMGVVLPFTTVFTAPTIRELAQCVLDVAKFGEGGIDSPIVLLNGHKGEVREGGRAIFAFPPATADALGYGQLADLLRPYAFYAFNFIEAEDRLRQYADLIMEADPEGPHLLFGYSGGGNLAFHTAKELESRGQRVAGIVMLDSARFMRKIRFTDQEVRGLAENFVDADIARDYITSQVLRDKAIRNIERYHAFFAQNQDDGSIDANIHVVLSENSPMVHVDADANVICSKPRWSEVTRGEFKTYQGYGGHNQMLYNPYLEPNMALLRGILDVACR
jgi:thioesterase domain-containing protein/acyl carrier protein